MATKKATTSRAALTDPLARMRFSPVAADRFELVARLGVPRDEGFVYYVPRAGGRVLRAPLDPKVPVRGPDDPGELVVVFADTTDRERYAVVVDEAGDVVRLRRRLGASYAMNTRCVLYERSTLDLGPALPLDESEVATVLEHLNDVAPDTFDEAGLGNWTFTGIEKTATKWVVAFDVGEESDAVAFATKHHLVDAQGQTSSRWFDALGKAVSRWSETRSDFGR